MSQPSARRPRKSSHLAAALVLAAAGITAAGAVDREVPKALTAAPPVDPYGADGGTVPLDGGPGQPVAPPAVAPPPASLPDEEATRPVVSVVSLPGNAGIPGVVLQAYQRAAASRAPGCGIPVALLAAIGKVESGHARGGQVDASGTAVRPILGPVLDGSGFAAIADTDGGALDGSATWDRAVGPMQFIPSTWRHWGADGNGDRVADPENVFDASLAAAGYLCAGGRNLTTPSGQDAAILSYNNSTAYLSLVRAWFAAYAGVTSETVAVPDIQTVAGGQPLDPSPTTPTDGGGQASGPHGGGATTTSPPPPPAKPGAPTTPGKPSSPTTPPTSSPLPPPSTSSPPPSSGPVAAVLDPVTGLLTCVVDGVGGLVGGVLGGLLGGGTPNPDLDHDGIPDAQECAG